MIILDDYLVYLGAAKYIKEPSIEEPSWQEYGELAEYLTANADVYSITDWTPKYGDQWEVSYATYDISTVLVGAGARTSSTTNDQYIFFPTTAFYIGNGGMSRNGFVVDGSSRPKANTRYTCKANKNEVSVNGQVIPYSTASNDTLVPFALGSVNNGGVLDKRMQKGEYYHLKVDAEDGTPKHNYVPFYVSKKTIQDVKGKNYPIGSFCWYDLVTNTVPETIGTWGGMTMEKSIQSLSELGVTPTGSIDTNLQMLNDMGIQ